MTLTVDINPMVPLNLLFLYKGLSALNHVNQQITIYSTNQQYLTHNFTNDDLTNGNTLAYQSLVNIPPAQLRSPLRPVPEETPVPATRTLSSVTVLPAEPALFSFSSRNISTNKPPRPYKAYRSILNDAAQRRPTLGGLPSPSPHQYCRRAQPCENYAPTDRA